MVSFIKTPSYKVVICNVLKEFSLYSKLSTELCKAINVLLVLEARNGVGYNDSFSMSLLTFE